MIISHSRLRFLPRSKIIHPWLLPTATSLLYPQFYTYPPYCLRCKQTQQEVPFLTWEEDVIYLFLQYICQHVFQFLCSSQARYKQKLKLCGLKDFSGDVWLNDPQEWPPVDFGNFYLINTLIDFFGSGGFCVTGSFLEQAIAHSALLFRKTAYLELLSSFFHEMRALAGPGTTPLNHGTD